MITKKRLFSSRKSSAEIVWGTTATHHKRDARSPDPTGIQKGTTSNTFIHKITSTVQLKLPEDG